MGSESDYDVQEYALLAADPRRSDVEEQRVQDLRAKLGDRVNWAPVPRHGDGVS